MTGGTPVPLHQRMDALAAAGHPHATALRAQATALRDALTAMDDAAASPVALRASLATVRRARLAWWRATGEQLDAVW